MSDFCIRCIRLSILAALLIVSACVSGPTSSGGRAPSGEGGYYKIGSPYKINGKWYRPAVDNDYVEVGIASWYGRDFHGRKTANGETFDMNAISAAHTTLPMPSYVEVKNLKNGKKIVVRVNDRGPFAKNRIIDLSRAAARKLGFEHEGVAKVRVRYVGRAPLPGEERQYAQPAIAPKTVALKTKPVPNPVSIPRQAQIREAVPVSASADPIANMINSEQGRYALPVDGLSIRVAQSYVFEEIEQIEETVRPHGAVRIFGDTNGLYRIELGPFANAESANQRLVALHEAGYNQAVIVRTGQL